MPQKPSSSIWEAAWSAAGCTLGRRALCRGLDLLALLLALEGSLRLEAVSLARSLFLYLCYSRLPIPPQSVRPDAMTNVAAKQTRNTEPRALLCREPRIALGSGGCTRALAWVEGCRRLPALVSDGACSGGGPGGLGTSERAATFTSEALLRLAARAGQQLLQVRSHRSR